MRLTYTRLCILLGLAIGWTPMLFHGPIAEKFNLFYLNGPVAVWAYYVSRLLIGAAVGISVVPQAWYVRGPLLGALLMAPTGFFSLATPGCGPV